jgi:UDP-glucose 4-epimerase
VSTYLVTGGLGYVGRFIVRQLVGEGARVVSYNRDFSAHPIEGVEAVQGELYDVPRLVRAIGAASVDCIIHTAAMSHPDLSVELPITTFSANVTGTLHVFEAARMAGVRRIVNFSSECAYGHVDGPVTEDARLQPTTPYGVTKAATELLAHVYNTLYDLDVISLRVGEVYGPENSMPEVLRDMIWSAVRGRPFRLAEGRDHRYHFVWVEDVARAALLAARCERREQDVFNVNGGPQLSLGDAADLVRRLVAGADIELGSSPPNLDRQGEWDTSAARRDLGYAPAVGIEDGIRRYAEWLEHHDF